MYIYIFFLNINIYIYISTRYQNRYIYIYSKHEYTQVRNKCLGVVRTLGMQKMGKHEYFGCCGNCLNLENGEEMIVWVLSKLSEFKKNREKLIVWVLWELSEFRKWGKH